jgi:fluoride exporter
MTKYLLVFVGGGIGSMARLFVTNLMGKQMGTAFPWGMLSVNLLGALVSSWRFGGPPLRPNGICW